MIEDAELLRRYAEERTEEAFAELVRRHLDRVYAVALRQVGGDAHLAEDVSQRVFADLARKAGELSRRAVIGGWLFRSTQFAATDVVRAERRRRAREQEADIMHKLTGEGGAAVDWEKLRPVLDEIMGELSDDDRDAVWLRYFEGRSFAHVGARLRLAENAARMRVERALEKLRGRLARRGVTSTSAALGIALANQATAAVPAGLAASVTGAALAMGGAIAASGGVGGWATIFTMSKIKTGLLGAGFAAMAITGVVELRANRELRAVDRGARSEADELGRLQRDNQRWNGELRKIGEKNPEAAELVRLNGRVAQLRARPDGVVDAEFKPIADAGRATPQETYVTFCAALNAGNIDGVAALITFRDDTKESREAFMASFSAAVQARYRTPERLFAAALFGMQEGVAWPDPAVRFQVLSDTEDREPGARRVRLWVQQAGGRESEIRDVFQRTPAGWALVFRPLADERTAAEIRGRIDPVTGQPKPAKK